MGLRSGLATARGCQWDAGAGSMCLPSDAERRLLGPLSAGTDDWPLSATAERGAVRKYL